VRTTTVPVKIGPSERVKKPLDQNLQLLPGHPTFLELQKVTPMSTAHSIR